MGRVILVGVALLLWAAPTAAAAPPLRLLYVSDWSGPGQVYAADPAGARPTGQITFGRAPACGATDWCGYGDPVPSPDGRSLLLADWAGCQEGLRPPSLYVARADGTHRRPLAQSHSQNLCVTSIRGSWARDSRRVAYMVDGELHVARVDRRSDRLVGAADDFAWSPDGRELAHLATTGSLWVERNGRERMVAIDVRQFAWSPNSRWIAYRSSTDLPSGRRDELAVVRSNGTAHRTLLTDAWNPQWSGDSRFLSVSATGGTAVLEVATGAARTVYHDLYAVAWRPHGHVLAVDGGDGTYAVDVVAGTQRLLTRDRADDLVWSPDGRAIAYLARSIYWTYRSGDLRVANLSGRVRTVVHAGGRYGGSISGLAWTRPPASTHYRRARPRVLADVRDDALTALWPITRLATDGERVAYVSCGRVFVWTPSTRAVVQAEPVASLSPRCTLHGNYEAFWIYTLALSGDRIAFGDLEGNMGQTWGLWAGGWNDPASFVSLGRVNSANGFAVGNGGLGDLVGSGGRLYFSTWRDDYAYPKARTLEQQIRRVDPSGCPCPVIAASPGPLVPFDSDEGRIVTGGENATLVYDPAGNSVVSIPVSPRAAQLAGPHLVVLRQGMLLDYDAGTGALRRAWPLPDVASGVECSSPHDGAWECGQPRLVLEDVAHGLATYVLDGRVHVLRLSDGVDATVAGGTLARFTDTGLVYANGATLRLVPYARLPVQP